MRTPLAGLAAAYANNTPSKSSLGRRQQLRRKRPQPSKLQRRRVQVERSRDGMEYRLPCGSIWSAARSADFERAFNADGRCCGGVTALKKMPEPMPFVSTGHWG
jgi:hypothetical protein